jgi:4-diphosphocytidyl-2-C-methyl-D-erythritol kinase
MRWFRAPAKVNLSLRVVGRRSDGLHEIESLVAFAEISDWLGYEPGRCLEINVEGPTAPEAGPPEKNLVLRAARALATHIRGLTLGRFRLVKRLPAAAGIGGGSSDAAAALAALAEANGLSAEDERLQAAAAESGADVPVCLFPKARIVSGVGERLGPPAALPRVFAVLANPRVPAPTRDVFEAFGLAPGSRLQSTGPSTFALDSAARITLDSLVSARNDLEPAALRVAPLIGPALDALSRLPGARAARMSGSGATCFALFDSLVGATTAYRMLVAQHPEWWVKASGLR